MFTVKGNQSLQATVVISPSDDPAIAPVPGRPGWYTGSTERAVFVAPPVTAPDTGVVTVPALAVGTYAMQLMEGGVGGRRHADCGVRLRRSRARHVPDGAVNQGYWRSLMAIDSPADLGFAWTKTSQSQPSKLGLLAPIRKDREMMGG
jgi:hypothetical protein